MADKIKLLMVEDNQSLAAIYASYVSSDGYDLCIVGSLEAAREEWQRVQPDVVLLDVELPDGNGLDLLRLRPEESREAEVIVMTAFGSSESAVDAIQLGAVDYLSKPFDADRLRVTLTNTLQHRQLSDQVSEISSLGRSEYCDFIGRSLPMQAVYRIIDSVAPSDATAFIVGESGTGKELTAAAIHQMSNRAGKPFHAINCGAIPRELMESELFGHVKGAFTGATTNRPGAAVVADGGTLFLDEICEMDLDLQKKMLRFIQTGEFQRVGSNTIERVNVRFVCATNKDPLEEVRAGRFREDLYYRLHVVPISLPPLRDRGDDIVEIAESFLANFTEKEGKAFTGFSFEAHASLRAYSWPGNVRELQNVVHKSVILHSGDVIEPDMLDLVGRDTCEGGTEHTEAVIPLRSETESQAPVVGFNAIEPLWLVEKRAIESAIERCGGNVNKAAGLLEVAPSTIYRKLQGWEKKMNMMEQQACTA